MLTAANIQTVALYAVLCVGINVTLWGIADKYRLYERYQFKRIKYLPEEWCYICLSFWAAMLYTVPVAYLSGIWLLMVAPFAAAGLTIRISYNGNGNN
jgi:hypothetical protein